MRETKPALCRICPAYCPILVTLEDGRAVEVAGDPEAPLYGGYSCPKGRALPEQHASPARLLHSLKRANGGFERIASTRAVTEVAERVQRIVAEHGPRSVALYIGTNSLPYPASSQLASAWLRALGSRMLFTSNTIDQPGKQIATALHGAWHAGGMEFASADAWLVVGQNPLISKSGALPMQNPGRQLTDALARGMKLIVIDPRRSETARRAHVHLQPRPGEDPTLLAAMLHVIFAEGLADAEFLRENADGAEELRAAVAPFTPEAAAARADVRAADIVRAARAFANARRGGGAAGTGPAFATRGNVTEYLTLCLITVCGFWPREGDPASRLNVLLPPYTPRAQPYPPYPALGGGEKLRVRGLENCAAGLPTAALPEEILLEGEGRVRALFCLGGNPMMAFPDQRTTQAALAKLDLLVTFDPELSATSRLAHYVIAPKLTLETPGMSQSAEALKFFGANVGYAAPFAQYAPALVAPPAHSELVEEWEFFYGMAQRLGLALTIVGFYGWGAHLESPPIVTKLDMQRKPSTDELFEIFTRGSRIPLAHVKRFPHGRVFDEVAGVVEAREAGCDARLQLAAPEMLRELAEIAREDWRAQHATASHPFRLIPRRSNFFVNSSGRSLPSLTRGKPWNPAHAHPDDLAALGVASGDVVRIRSRHDEALAVIEADDTLRRGVVAMTHAFGANPGEPDDPRAAGTPLGRLLRLDDDYDPISGIPRMGALPIAIERVR
ncbi:MAG: molybdopterin-dependent oxidoreductase [Myxococcota bacterium]